MSIKKLMKEIQEFINPFERNVHFKGFSQNPIFMLRNKEELEHFLDKIRELENIIPEETDYKDFSEHLKKIKTEVSQILSNKSVENKKIKKTNTKVISTKELLLRKYWKDYYGYDLQEDDHYSSFKKKFEKDHYDKAEYIYFNPSLDGCYLPISDWGTMFKIDAVCQFEKIKDEEFEGIMGICINLGFDQIINYRDIDYQLFFNWKEFQYFMNSLETKSRLYNSMMHIIKNILNQFKFTSIDLTDDNCKLFPRPYPHRIILFFQTKLASNDWPTLFDRLYSIYDFLFEFCDEAYREASRLEKEYNSKIERLIKDHINKRENDLEEIDQIIEHLEKFKNEFKEDVEFYKIYSDKPYSFPSKNTKNGNNQYSLEEIIDFFSKVDSGWYTIRRIFDELRRNGIEISKKRLYDSFKTLENTPNFKQYFNNREWKGQGSRSGKKSKEYRLKEKERITKEFMNNYT